MRLFFTGPKVLGIRPGVSFGAAELTGSQARREPGAPANCSFVYVVRGDHNMVKIGVTTNPDARIAQLRTGSAFPIEYAYLGVTSGTGYDIEQATHAALTRYRCHGEWFDVRPDIAVAAIAAASYQVGQPIAQIPPGQAAQVLRLSAQQPTVTAASAPAVGPIARALFLMLAGAFVMVVLLIAIGNHASK